MGVDVAAAGSGVGSVVVVGEGDAWRPEALGAPSKVESLVGSCPWSTHSSAMLSPASFPLSLFLFTGLVSVVLPLPTEGTGDSTPVVIRHLCLGAGVGLLLLPLDYEALSLLAVWGVLQPALLISGITPEELLDVFPDTGVFGCSPLSRSGSLVPFALASSASPSRTVVVQVLVPFFLQRRLQE